MFNRHLFKRSLTGALVIAAAAIPAAPAQAMYLEASGGSSGQVQPAPPVASQPKPSQPAAISGSSFEWGDAGIGAAGAIILVGVGAVGAGMTRRRRPRRAIG